MGEKFQIDENLYYRNTSNGDIILELDITKIIKVSSESGMSALISSNHTNWRPLNDSNIDVRFNIFTYSNEPIEPKQDWWKYNTYREIGENLYFKYKDEKTIRVKFNPNKLLYQSNSGKSYIIASNAGNEYPFFHRNISARITIFTYA